MSRRWPWPEPAPACADCQNKQECAPGRAASLKLADRVQSLAPLLTFSRRPRSVTDSRATLRRSRTGFNSWRGHSFRTNRSPRVCRAHGGLLNRRAGSDSRAGDWALISSSECDGFACDPAKVEDQVQFLARTFTTRTLQPDGEGSDHGDIIDDIAAVNDFDGLRKIRSGFRFSTSITKNNGADPAITSGWASAPDDVPAAVVDHVVVREGVVPPGVDGYEAGAGVVLNVFAVDCVVLGTADQDDSVDPIAQRSAVDAQADLVILDVVVLRLGEKDAVGIVSESLPQMVLLETKL
jgi:hypothetical protein